LTDDEFECDGGEEKNKRQLKSTLRDRQIDRERRERQTADEQLYATIHTLQSLTQCDSLGGINLVADSGRRLLRSAY